VLFGGAEAELGRTRLPVSAKLVQVGGGLGVARRDGGDLRCAPARGGVLGEVRDDLRAAGRERAQHGVGDAADLGHALDGWLPVDTEARRQLVAELRLVQRPGGEAVGAQQQVAVERAPRAVGALGHVRDDHVRVQVRIERAARAVRERGGDEARAPFADDAVSAAARDAGRLLEIGERGLPGGLVCLARLEANPLIPERVQQAHALRRAEHQIEPRHRPQLPLHQSPHASRRVELLDPNPPHRHHSAQLAPGGGVHSAHQPPQVAVLDDTDEPQPRRASPVPDAGRLAATRVVVIQALRDARLVVRLLPRRELRDTQQSAHSASRGFAWSNRIHGTELP
jgi:hypothetical protein